MKTEEADPGVMLESPGQLRIRELVKALPEETLSLAWRSGLNGKLQAQVAHRRSRWLGLVWKPAAGLALAGVVAAAFVFRLQPSPPADSGASAGVERALVSTYKDSAASWDVAGDGMTAGEVKDSAESRLPASDWNEEDVGATL